MKIERTVWELYDPPQSPPPQKKNKQKTNKQKHNPVIFKLLGQSGRGKHTCGFFLGLTANHTSREQVAAA